MSGMKSKTIRKVLRTKFDRFVNSIEDENVKRLVKNNTIVTGGAIASMLLGEPVNDFDIYFRNRETTLAVANYYIKTFQGSNANLKIYVREYSTDLQVGAKLIRGVDKLDPEYERIEIYVASAGVANAQGTNTGYTYFETQSDDSVLPYVEEVLGPGAIEDKYEELNQQAQQAVTGKFLPVFVSSNAITLSDKIQIVIRFFGEPDKIHENYDFVHCTNYWTSWDNELVLKQPALESLMSKELRYVGSKYPLCSIIRLRKFIGRGWTINAGQILKMAMQISELDLKNIDVLRDQLTGVDSAYFLQVIQRLSEKQTETGVTTVDTTYLVEIIDRIF